MKNRKKLFQSRRDFMKLSGIGLAASITPGTIAGSFQSRNTIPGSEIPFELGIASYTFRKFNLEDTISMTKKLGIGNLALKSMHMPMDSSPGEIVSISNRVRKAGINLYGAGVVYMESSEQVDQAFNYAVVAGIKVIIGVPNYELLEYCHQKVKELDIKLAIHNHGPGDLQYPSPESIYSKVKDMDSRMGLCMDIGHTRRIGLDPALEAEKYMDRLHDVHIKDVDRPDESGTTIEVGRGIIDIPKFLTTLIEKRYSGVVSFEYEKDGDDPLAGLAESVGYVRGVLCQL